MTKPIQTQTGIDRYFTEVQRLQEQVIGGQKALLEEIARRMAEAVGAGRRIFAFGTGHSHLLAEEGFYRAGGLAAVTPVTATSLMLHENVALASRLERSPDLAGLLLDPHAPQAGEMLFIYSNSGVNRLPVEMALEGRRRGLVVVAVCSLAYARVAPLSEANQRLFEVSDYCIDNGGEPGDGLVSLPGMAWRVGPSSTVVNALIWNCLVTETARVLVEAGVTPPVLASLNMPGAEDHNRELFEKWRRINPSLW